MWGVVGSVPCVQKVAGSNPTLATMQGPLEVLHLYLYVALWRVNSDSINDVVGSASE